MDKKVVLMANSECNAKCKHCYISYQGHRKPEKVVELIRSFHGQGYDVTVAGSELLLNPKYLKPYQIAGQKYMLTNGILISQKPELIDELIQHGIEEIRISLHFGIEKELQSVPEQVVAKAIANSRQKGLPAKLSTTITQANYQKVLEICDKTYDLDSFGIKFLRYVDTSKTGDFLTLNQEQREEFFERIDEARAKYTKDELEILVHGNFGPKKGSKGEKLAELGAYCPACVNLFVIDPNDNVYGCPLLMEFPIGKLVNGKMEIEKELCEGKRDKCLTDYLL